MNKKGIFKILIAVVFVAAAVVWLLSVIMPEAFGDINLAWIIAAFSGLLGLLFIGRGLFGKGLTVTKKFSIVFGAIFVVAGVLALVGSIIDDKLILPIIAVAVTGTALICMLAVGGKKWDTADNEKVGYKTYRERKAEEEKAKNKE